MESNERYLQLSVPELQSLDNHLSDEIWKAMDLVHALKIGRAAVRNTLKELYETPSAATQSN